MKTFIVAFVAVFLTSTAWSKPTVITVEGDASKLDQAVFSTGVYPSLLSDALINGRFKGKVKSVSVSLDLDRPDNGVCIYDVTVKFSAEYGTGESGEHISEFKNRTHTSSCKDISDSLLMLNSSN